jgi:ankyrin repeat protein
MRMFTERGNFLNRYLLNAGADVHAQTQTGDTALTYACENGHTDVAELLLRAGAELEHESEGGRTPLMKACRAGHVCTVQFLVGKVRSSVHLFTVSYVRSFPEWSRRREKMF